MTKIRCPPEPEADDLECSIRDVGPTKIAQMIIRGWPWPTLLHVLKVNLHFDLSSMALIEDCHIHTLYLNIFFSENTGLIELKFHNFIDLTFVLGYLTKLAIIPIYGNTKYAKVDLVTFLSLTEFNITTCDQLSGECFSWAWNYNASLKLSKT